MNEYYFNIFYIQTFSNFQFRVHKLINYKVFSYSIFCTVKLFIVKHQTIRNKADTAHLFLMVTF